MKQFYAIQEICELTSVSVRTLHYYDEKDILKPSHRTHKGHRLYSQQDLFCLQQILTFKFLGFPLSQIKKMMHDKGFDIAKSLKMQKKALSDELERIEKTNQFFNFFADSYDESKEFDWENMAHLMSIFKQKQTDINHFFQKYLTQHEQQKFDELANVHAKEWQVLFQEVKDKTISTPDTPEVNVVKKWVALANEAYGDQPDLINKLWKAYQAGVLPNISIPFDKDVVAYLTKAFKKLQTEEGV